MAIDLQVLLGMKKPRKRDYSKKLWFVPFNTTWACGLDCSFCYGKTRTEPTLSTQDIKTHIIDNIADSTAQWMGFTGGDPLTRSDWLECMVYAKNTGLDLVLSTNGVNLTTAKINALASQDITRIGIGISELSERYSKTMGGPYFERVDKAIRECVDYGFDVSLRSVPTKLNHKTFLNLVDYAADRGVYKFCRYNMIYAGKASPAHDISEPQKDQMVLDLLNKQAEYPDLKIWLMERPFDNVVLSHQGFRPALKTLNYGKCGAAKALLNIAPNGDIYPCPYFGEITEPIGNATRDRLKDIALSGVRLDLEHGLKDFCGECNEADICGGCRFHALKFRGDILGGDPYCRMM